MENPISREGEETMGRFRNFFERGRTVLWRHRRKIVLGIGLFFLLFTLIGFFALPPLLKYVLTQQLTKHLHREVTIQKISLNPYTLSVTVRGLLIKDRENQKPFVSFDEFYLNLQSLSVLKGVLLVKEVRVKQPYIRIVRHTETTYNFSDLLEGKKEPQPVGKGKEKTKPFLFSINNIRIENGSIDFWDGPKETEHKVRELQLGVPFISNVPYYIDTFVQPTFSARINDTPHSYQGKTKPFADSVETIFDINFRDLNIPYYLAYSPMKLNLKIPSGLLDAKMQISFVQSKNRVPSLTVTGDMALKQFAVDDPKDSPVLRLPRVDLSLAPTEPLRKIIHLSKLSMEGVELNVIRTASGQINLESLLPKETDSKKKDSQEKAPSRKEPTAPLILEIDSIQLQGGKITFTDLLMKPFKTVLHPVDLRVDHFSNVKEKSSGYALSLRTEANETVKVEGDMTMEPLRAQGQINLEGIPLKRYAPYYRDHILFDLEDGRLDFSTRYQYAKGGKEPEVLLSDLAASLRSLRLRKRGEKDDFLKVPLLSIKDTQIHLPERKLTLGECSTEKGMVFVNRAKNGEIDLQKLFTSSSSQEGSAKSPQRREGERPWLVTLRRLSVDQYAVRIDDQGPSQPTAILLERIKVRGENLSTGKNALGKLALSVWLDRTATLSTQAAVGIDPLRLEGSLEIKQIPFKPYAPYYRDRIRFDFESGELDLTSKYRYARKEKGDEISLSGLSLSLRQLRLKKRGEEEEFLNIPALALRNTSLDLNRKEITVGEFITQRGSILARRLKDGKLNFQTLLPEAERKEAKGEGSPGHPPVKPVEGGTKEMEKPWIIRVGKISVDDYRMKAEDEAGAEPVVLGLEGIRLSAKNLSTVEGEKGELSMALRFQERGSVSFSGSIGISPLTADLKMNVSAVEIKPFQPYFTDKVRITVTDGRFSTTGDLSVRGEKEKGLQIAYKGSSALNHFASIDKAKAEDFLKWQSLSFEGLDVSYQPLRVKINGIALTDFYARVIIGPDGTLNLSQIMAKEEPSKERRASAQEGEKGTQEAQGKGTAEEGPSSKDIQIQTVTLQGGTVEFSDRSIKPEYGAKLVEIGGRVSGLSSEETSTADLDLRGKLEGSAPLEITGRINPLKKDLYVDLKVRFKDMDLSPVTPYAGKYAGYTIQKGKLSLDLQYLIDKRKLDSQNIIFLDQFTFGEKVESPHATKLPVKLAIALLKNRKGEIRLDIPVKGSLDDPKFSIGKIILQIILNLIAKAATSPFALLGAIFGGGEELSYLEFDYGTAVLTEANVKKLSTLIKALADRPGLKLDIEGHVDPERDREALIQYFFERKLKAQKLNEMVKKKLPPVPLDEVKIEAAEYAKYLKMAYKQEKFPKPTYILGIEKDLPVPEMEKLMLTHIVVGENELRTLASQRALKVKEAILKSGEVESERVFIVEPKSLAPEKKEKLKESRVELKLK